MSERKKKNWIPWEKADYVKELVEIINQESDDAALAEKLSVYHENDIAEAFELLDEAGRRKLYLSLIHILRSQRYGRNWWRPGRTACRRP